VNSLKNSCKEAVASYCGLHGGRVPAKDVVGIVSPCYLRSMTYDTAKTAFEMSGIIPFNPSMVLNKLMKKSISEIAKKHVYIKQPPNFNMSERT
jgi:hypothetical protein